MEDTGMLEKVSAVIQRCVEVDRAVSRYHDGIVMFDRIGEAIGEVVVVLILNEN